MYYVHNCEGTVVNYIQILYLCILKQLLRVSIATSSCCELHSNLVSLHSETTIPISVFIISGLWITFKSCIFAFWNNDEEKMTRYPTVVNYIQILYLCILKQQSLTACSISACCELHSNLVSLHSETTFVGSIDGDGLLWITFKSCIFAFWNNICSKYCSRLSVVNYIQILYLCILKQLFRLD